MLAKRGDSMTLPKEVSVWEDFYLANGYGGLGVVGETENEWVLQGKHANDLGNFPQPIIIDKKSGVARWCYIPLKSDRDILSLAEKNSFAIK